MRGKRSPWILREVESVLERRLRWPKDPFLGGVPGSFPSKDYPRGSAIIRACEFTRRSAGGQENPR